MAAEDTERQITHKRVRVHEFYGNFVAPFDALTLTAKLLQYAPERYLVGLYAIVLTDISALPRYRRRAHARGGYQVGTDYIRGLYHHGEEPWIEIFVDRLIEHFPQSTWKLPVMRDLFVAEVVYHELGHHIHATHHPEYQDIEKVARRWSGKLTWRYLTRRYWYLYPFLLLLRLAGWLSLNFQRRRRGR